MDRNVVLPKQLDRAPVALRKESVDRNKIAPHGEAMPSSRSP